MRAWMTMLALCAQACGPILWLGPGDFVGDRDAPDLTPSATDVLAQPVAQQLDVLWVIDTSASMAEERPKLLDSLPSFLWDLEAEGLDWHVGVVTMGESAGRPLGGLVEVYGKAFVTPSAADDVLTQMASAEDDGGPAGRGFLAALYALTMPTPALAARNAGFLRDAAALHVIVVSDQDDQSAPELTRAQFVDALRNLKANPTTRVAFSAIVGDTPPGCGAVPGGQYVDAAEALGGEIRSTCDADWRGRLHATDPLVEGYNREFFLTRLPSPASMEVWVVDADTEVLGVDLSQLEPGESLEEACANVPPASCAGYTYDLFRNSITFDEFAPSPGAEVHVRYDVLAAP